MNAGSLAKEAPFAGVWRATAGDCLRKAFVAAALVDAGSAVQPRTGAMLLQGRMYQ